MSEDRLRKLLESIGLDEGAVPDEVQWDALLSALDAELDAADRWRRMAETWQSFQQNTGDSILTLDLEGRILSLNRTFTRPLDEIVGSSVFDHVTPENASRMRNAMQAVLRTGEPVTFVARGPGRAGASSWYETELGPIRVDGEVAAFCMVGRDVTERKRADRELRRSEAVYANLFRHSTDGIVLHDLEGVAIDANHRALSLFGLDLDELVGLSIRDLQRVDAFEELGYDPRGIEAEQVLETETRFLRKGGEEFVAEVSATAFHLDDRPVVQVILRDITERHLFEASLRRAKEEAERASRAKSQFLSNMSHELRTPLNAILGFGRVLARGAYGELNPRQRQYLNDIIHSGEHMLELVNNLLDLRRLEDREELLDAQDLPIRPLIEEAAAMVGPLVEGKRQHLEIRTPTDLPEVVADRRAVIRTLVNLLSNAVKFTEPDGRIEIHTLKQGDYLKIEVLDNGIGVASEHQKRIFRYFEQVPASGAPDASGSGIGLALSRELVERMGGTIGVRSRPGQGSCFYFTLRCASRAPESTTRRSPVKARSEPHEEGP